MVHCKNTRGTYVYKQILGPLFALQEEDKILPNLKKEQVVKQ